MSTAPSQSFLTLLTCMVTLYFFAIMPAFPQSGRQVRLPDDAEPVHISRLNGYQQYWKTPMVIEGQMERTLYPSAPQKGSTDPGRVLIEFRYTLRYPDWHYRMTSTSIGEGSSTMEFSYVDGVYKQLDLPEGQAYIHQFSNFEAFLRSFTYMRGYSFLPISTTRRFLGSTSLLPFEKPPLEPWIDKLKASDKPNPMMTGLLTKREDTEAWPEDAEIKIRFDEKSALPEEWSMSFPTSHKLLMDYKVVEFIEVKEGTNTLRLPKRSELRSYADGAVSVQDVIEWSYSFNVPADASIDIDLLQANRLYDVQKREEYDLRLP